MKAYGPGLQSSGLAVGQPAEFTVDAKLGGKAPLKIQAQVKSAIQLLIKQTQWFIRFEFKDGFCFTPF